MLKDKVAVITGCSYGMGRTMAELFAEEGRGGKYGRGRYPRKGYKIHCVTTGGFYTRKR